VNRAETGAFIAPQLAKLLCVSMVETGRAGGEAYARKTVEPLNAFHASSTSSISFLALGLSRNGARAIPGKGCSTHVV
jgi:hypothetical protein